jgi:hypothetical protein
MAGLSLVALAFAPAMAGDQKSKTSDTLQVPSGGASATVDSKTDASTQTQGTVTTESPSASPSTTPSTPEKADSTVNPSMKSDAPQGSSEKPEDKDKPKY